MHAHTERNIKETSSQQSWAKSVHQKRGTKERETEIGTERDKYSHRAGKIETRRAGEKQKGKGKEPRSMQRKKINHSNKKSHQGVSVLPKNAGSQECKLWLGFLLQNINLFRGKSGLEMFLI